MKYILILLLLFSCATHPSKRKDVKHLVKVPNGDNSEYFYVISNIVYLDNNCISFTCISNYDFETKVNKTVCGTYIIEY